MSTGHAPAGTGLACRSWDEITAIVHRVAPPEPGKSLEFVTRVIVEANDPDYGYHRNKPGGPVSADVISRRGFGIALIAEGPHADEFERRITFTSRDITGAADGAAPTPVSQHIDYYREDAAWVPYFTEDRRQPIEAPRRDLGRLAVSANGWTLDGKPWQWRGCTAFDLPVRLAKGDRSFVDIMVRTRFTIARVVVFTRWRMERSPADALKMLPRTLDVLSDAGMCAELVVVCDGRDANMPESEALWLARETGVIAADYGIAPVELFNEIGHAGQPDYAKNAGVLAAMRAQIPAHVPVSVGSSHGGLAPTWDLGDYITHHSSRSKTPEFNAELMAEAQLRFGKPVIDDEAIGYGPRDITHKRKADPDWFARQGRAAKAHHIGATFHSEAGLSASSEFWDAGHQDAADRFVEAMR